MGIALVDALRPWQRLVGRAHPFQMIAHASMPASMRRLTSVAETWTEEYRFRRADGSVR